MKSMNYSDSLRYLNSFLNLERIIFHPKNRLWNLKRMDFLMKWFAHPEKRFLSVLIAGTKGKGSTGFFLESILKASGVPVGFYSSPHLEDPRERIRIRGSMLSKEKWVEGVRLIRDKLMRHKLPAAYGDFTYFEILTLLAMIVFEREGVDCGIFEVGMGGRLDATNCLEPSLVILTPIHLDHEAFLGNTITKIAREKTAIIGRYTDVVASPQTDEAWRVIKSKVRKEKATLWKVRPLARTKIGLLGDYQLVNAGAALEAAMILKRRFNFPVTRASTFKGLQSSDWPGRLELFKGRPDFLLDGAHNPISVKVLVANLKRIFHRKDILLVFGAARDKKAGAMLQTLGTFFNKVILSPIPNPRTQEMGVLLKLSRKYFQTVYPVGSVEEAVRLARSCASPGTLVVATGSFYLIGEIRKILRLNQKPGR